MLPTFEDTQRICAANDSFKTKFEIINNTQVAQCTYFLATNDDFFDAFGDGSLFDARELRGVTFTRDVNGMTPWKRHLFINKFFNVNQTAGIGKTTVHVKINGVEHTLDSRTLFCDDAESLFNAWALKPGMQVEMILPGFERSGKIFKIDTVEVTVPESVNPEMSWMASDLKKNGIVRVANKEDGSAIRFLMLGGELVAKTKFSFESPQTVLAMQVVAQKPALRGFILKSLEQNLAAIFEIVSPFNQVVLNYKTTELRLLQLRDEATGEYQDIYNHPLVQEFNITTAQCEDLELIKRVADKLDIETAKRLLGDKKFDSVQEFMVFLDLSA